jgi:hypothetical protein
MTNQYFQSNINLLTITSSIQDKDFMRSAARRSKITNCNGAEDKNKCLLKETMAFKKFSYPNPRHVTFTTDQT